MTPPGPDVPPEAAGFSGTWVGAWYIRYAIASCLVVEKIQGRSVTLVFSFAPNEDRDKANSRRYTGSIGEDGILRFELVNGGRINYRMHADRMALDGQYDLNGRIANGNFTRSARK